MLATESEGQVGAAEREASAYWFETSNDGHVVGSAPVNLAQDWAEYEEEGGLARVRQVVTRNVGAVGQLVTEPVAMVRRRRLYRVQEARRKSRHLIAAEIHLSTSETRKRITLTRLSILTSFLLFSSVARSVATLARSSYICRAAIRASFASSRAASNSSSAVSSSGASSIFASMRSGWDPCVTERVRTC